MKSRKGALLALLAVGVPALQICALLTLNAFAAWDKTKPPTSGALVSADIRANWQAIEDVLGVAPSATAVLVLPKHPTFKPGGAATAVRASGRMFSNITTVGNVGTGQDDLHSNSIEASTLDTDGKVLRLTYAGQWAANANSKTVRFVWGATTLTFTATTANDGEWELVVHVTRTGAATQRLIGRMNGQATTGTFTSVKYGTATETLSGAVTAKITGDATANDDITAAFSFGEVIG